MFIRRVVSKAAELILNRFRKIRVGHKTISGGLRCKFRIEIPAKK